MQCPQDGLPVRDGKCAQGHWQPEVAARMLRETQEADDAAHERRERDHRAIDRFGQIIVFEPGERQEVLDDRIEPAGVAPDHFEKLPALGVVFEALGRHVASTPLW